MQHSLLDRGASFEQSLRRGAPFGQPIQPPGEPTEDERRSLARINTYRILDQGGSEKDIQEYLKTTGFTVQDVMEKRLVQGEEPPLFQRIARKILPEPDIGREKAEAFLQQQLTEERTEREVVALGTREQWTQKNAESIAKQGGSLEDVTAFIRESRQPELAVEEPTVSDVTGMEIGRPGPVGIAGQVVGGIVESQTLGFGPTGRKPRGTAEEMGRVVGQIAGLTKGIPAKAGRIAEKALKIPSKVTDPLVATIAKEVIRKGVSLPTTLTAANLGKILADDDWRTVLKESIVGGAELGAEFGALGLIDFKRKIPSFLVRMGGKLALDNAIHGDTPWDDRELEDKSFSYIMDAFFLWKGRSPKAIRDALQRGKPEDIKKVRQLIDERRRSEQKLIGYEPGPDFVMGRPSPDFQLVPRKLKTPPSKNLLPSTHRLLIEGPRAVKREEGALQVPLEPTRERPVPEELAVDIKKNRIEQITSKPGFQRTAGEMAELRELTANEPVSRKPNSLSVDPVSKYAKVPERPPTEPPPPNESETENLYSGIHPEQARVLTERWENKMTENIGRFNERIAKNRYGKKWLQFWNPLSTLADPEAYYLKRLKFEGTQGLAVDSLRKLVKEIDAKPKGMRKNLYRYMIGEVEAKNPAAKRLMEPAEKARKLIEELGEGLVERGVLSKAQFLAHKGKYLPRLYLEYILRSEGAHPGSRTRMDLRYTKQRGKTTEEFRRLKGEITDPSFLVSEAVGREWGDTNVYDFFDAIARNPKEAYQGSLKQWKAYQDIMAVGKKPSKADRLYTAPFIEKEIGLFRKMIAKEPSLRKDYGPVIKEGEKLLTEMDKPDHGTGWKQVPNSKSFGSLRGMWVREEIAKDLDIGVIGKGTRGFLEKINTLFKISKVPLNLPTQIRNMVSNTVLLDLSGMPYHEQAKYFPRVLSEIKNNGTMYQMAKKFGLFSTTFTNVELAQVRRIFMANATGSPIDIAKKWIGKGVDIPLNLYGKIEAVGKTARFMFAMESEGKSPEQAAITAQKSLFDYSLVPQSIETLRRMPIGAPFITFQYKVLPLLAETALKRPWKLVKYAALPYALLEGTKKRYDVTDKDWDELVEMLPRWIDKNGVWVIPYKDEKTGRWTFTNVSYFVPWGNITSIVENVGRADVQQAVADTGIFGGPVPSFAIALKTGRNPYTGQELYDPSDDGNDKLVKFMYYMWELSMPTMITDIGVAGHVKDYIEGRTDKYGVPLSPVNVFPRAVGINTYPISQKEAKKTKAITDRAKRNALTKEKIRTIFNKKLLPKEKKAKMEKINQRLRELRNGQ